MRIKGNTVGFPNPQTNWDQTNEILADFLLNKPENVTSGGAAATSVHGVREGQTITLTFPLEGGGQDVLVVTVDSNDLPTNVNVNGVDKPVVLEGF